MKKDKLVSESVIKETIKEFFDPSSSRMKQLARYTTDPWVLMYQTSPATDPNMATDAPLNPDIVPQNKRELEISLKELMKDIEDVDVPEIFKQIKEIIEELLEEEDEDEMKKEVNEAVRAKVRTLIEEAKNDTPAMINVRRSIRKMIKEAYSSKNDTFNAYQYHQDTSVYGKEYAESRLAAGEYGTPPGQQKQFDDDDEPKAPAGKKHRTVSDVGGSSWEPMKAISGHQGKGTSGIEQYVYGKPTRPGGPPEGGLVQDLMNVIAASAPIAAEYVKGSTQASRGAGDPEKGKVTAQRSQIVRDTINTYVDYLASSGVLEDDEIQFLKDNPEAVETRPLFHDMLKKAVDNLSAEDKSGEMKQVVKKLNSYLRQLQSKFGE